MSHVLQSSIIIKDLECLDAAVRSMGATLVRNVKTYNWYGRSVGDYPIPEGMTKEQLGHCDHVIRLPGVHYEIGVCGNQKDGSFRLQYDFYSGGLMHDGQKLKTHFGDGLSRLQTAYTESTVRKQAQSHGYSVTRKVLTNGAISLQLTPTGKGYGYQRVTA